MISMKKNFFTIMMLVAITLLVSVASANVISIENGQVNTIGGTDIITLVLDDAPNGLAGYIINVNIENPAVARITSVSYPSWAGLTSMPTLPSTNIELKAADIGGLIGDSATGITLATLTIEGLSSGSTAVSAMVNRIDDDDENMVTPTIALGTFIVDLCPDDSVKTAPGICGCGVSDTNTDGDTLADCEEECDTDPLKTVPGLCGCGTADWNSDGDSLPDCTDGCPADPAKTAPGICGCGNFDIPGCGACTDTDSDGVCDIDDNCPAVANPTQTDTDGDGIGDACDGCLADAGKTVPGICGCGVAETDSDSDGTPNCNDTCPADPAKTVPGTCGCGVAETDSDTDGTPDCTDECDSDPAKTAPGACGCGNIEVAGCGACTDTDSDGVCDVDDNCPAVANPAQTDTDSDGIGDMCDGCPADAGKTLPGICGCGVADTDSDLEGTPNCNDTCPADPAKIVPGTCGCGVADTDSDLDGTPNCTDGCDSDPAKTVPGACGCGNIEVPGCGACTDTDSDGVCDVDDNCPAVANQAQTDTDSDGIGDTCDTPAEGPADMITHVKSLGLPKGIENSFTVKLDAAIAALDRGNEKAAINNLNAFINYAEAQSGKKLNAADADALIAEAKSIISDIMAV
jgi:hypothetical protein